MRREIFFETQKNPVLGLSLVPLRGGGAGGAGGLEPPQLYQLYAVEFLLSVMFTLSLKNRPLHILRASMQAGAPRQLGHVTKIQPPQLSTRSAAPASTYVYSHLFGNDKRKSFSVLPGQSAHSPATWTRSWYVGFLERSMADI